MYEIGRVYIWHKQVGIATRINGVECIPDAPPAWYLNKLTQQLQYGQSVVNSDGEEWIACKGDLRPKYPPTGEQSITDLFKVPQHEPA